MLTVIEKVIFLQDIDIFQFTATEDLAHLAAITEEMEIGADETLFKEGDISDAMYMVVKGKVGLARKDQEVMVAEDKDFFGTWALIDDEPREVTAVTIEECHLLKIHKADFIDLLADNIKITQSILKKMVKRLRGLMTRVRR